MKNVKIKKKKKKKKIMSVNSEVLVLFKNIESTGPYTTYPQTNVLTKKALRVEYNGKNYLL